MTSLNTKTKFHSNTIKIIIKQIYYFILTKIFYLTHKTTILLITHYFLSHLKKKQKQTINIKIHLYKISFQNIFNITFIS